MLLEKLAKVLFGQFTDISGRGSRLEYWTFVAISLPIYWILLYISHYEIIFISLFYFLLLLLASIRRYHDVGRRAIWMFVPFANVYFLFCKGVEVREPEFSKTNFGKIKDYDVPIKGAAGKLINIDISTFTYPLTIINISKYILIIGCAYLALKSILIATGTSGQIIGNDAHWALMTSEQLAIYILFSKVDSVEITRLLFLFSVFFLIAVAVGWANIGNLGFSGSRLVWLIFGSIFVFTFYNLYNLNWQNVYTVFYCACTGTEKHVVFLALVISALIVVSFVSIIALFGLCWMEFGQIEAVDRRASEIMLFRRQFFNEKYGRLSIGAKNPFAGVCFLGGALIVIMFIEYLNKRTLSSFTAMSWLWLYVPVFMMIIHARQNFQPSMKKLLAMDKRKPTVLLRSFSDEAKSIQADPLGVSIFDYSLEDRIGNYFSYTGPFVAVGSPNDSSPQLGAVRTQIADDKWQAHVLNWIQTSDTIVLLLGVSYWLNWELDQVIANKYWNKLIILFPEESGLYAGQLSVDRARERRDYFIFAMRGTRWAGALQRLESVDPKNLRSIILHGDGNVTVITGKLRSREAYHAGAILAHYLLLRSRNRTETSQSEYWSKLRPLAERGSQAISAYVPKASRQKDSSTWFEVLGSGARIPLDSSGGQIGRHENSEIRIDGRTVHRRHAMLHVSPQREFVITDVSGTDGNGVIVNSVRVQSKPLRDGDIVQLGEVRLRFRASAA